MSEGGMGSRFGGVFRGATRILPRDLVEDVATAAGRLLPWESGGGVSGFWGAQPSPAEASAGLGGDGLRSIVVEAAQVLECRLVAELVLVLREGGQGGSSLCPTLGPSYTPLLPKIPLQGRGSIPHNSPTISCLPVFLFGGHTQ